MGVSMTYFQNLSRPILKALEIRANRFVDSYDPEKRLIILIPGRMGSMLMKCKVDNDEDNFPDNSGLGNRRVKDGCFKIGYS
jgi:hypothetical protein